MKFLANILAKAGLIVDGTTQLNTIANATIDTDRFLVSDGGVVKYRTGAQLLSDIGPITTSTLKHQVKLGENIAKGQAVYVSSADGTNMIVSKASNTSEATSSKTLGLIETGGVTNAQVSVITEGLLAGLDTSTAVAGDPVWLGTNGNLIFGLVNKPYAPAHLVFIGIVTRVQQNNGEIFVKVQNGFELQEIHNVSALNPTNNDGIFYNSSTQLWEKKSIPTVLGYTPANAARVLTINGVSYDLTADRTWSVGTVTSVAALTLGTTGTDLSSSVANGTTTPVITLNVPTASATNRGALSSTDWTTFNNKQNAITLTTTGSSGSATLISNTLNIPTYTLAGLGGISLTSLSAFVPLVYNNTTGQFSIIQSSGSNDGYLSATDWTTFNNKQNAITLTTTGTSGAATLVGSTLNIPQYQSVLTNPITGTGTSGQVSYFNGTNSITSESNLFWDATNDRLGIGTSTPNYVLTALYSATGQNGIRVRGSNASAQAQLFIENDLSTGFVFGVTGTSVTPYGANAANQAVIYSTAAITLMSDGSIIKFASGGNTERMRLFTSGNLGINTTTDAGFRLDIAGTARVQGQLSLGVSGTAGRVNLARSTDGTMIGSIFTSGEILVIDNQSTSVQIRPGSLANTFGFLSSGNFVISTTGALTDNASALITMNSTSKGFLLPRMSTANRDAISTPATGLSVYNTSTNTNDYYNGSAWLNVGQVLAPANNTTGFSISGSSLTGSNAQSLVSLSQTWNTTGNPTAFLLNITNTASGATADLMDLQVGGASRFEITAAGRARLGAYGSGTITGTATYNLAVDASGNVIEVTGGGGGGGIGGSGTTNYLPKFTASTTLGNSQIFDDGTNVGVGTATPSQKLEVSGSGNIAIRAVSSDNFPLFQLRDNRTPHEWNIENGRIAGALGFYYATGNATRMLITSAGNVGIQTTTIGSALQVNGNAAIGYSSSTAAPTNGLQVAGSITGASNSNTFGTSSASGYPVIINTGSGSNSLKINGRNNAPGDESGIEFFRFDGVTRVAFIQASTNFFAFATSSEAMRINSSNFLGIGTTTIGSRLQVNGGAAIGYSASTAAPTNGLIVAGQSTFNDDMIIRQSDANTTSYFASPRLIIQNTSATVGNFENLSFSAANGDDVAAIWAINTVHTATASTGQLVFGTTNAGASSVERMRINNTGSVFIGNGETAGTPALGIISGTGGTGTNVAGAEFRIRGGASTGSGAGGPITFYTSAAGSAGTTVNAGVERMRIYSDGMVRTFMSTTNTTQYFASARITIQQTSATNNNFANLSFLGANSDDAAAIYSQISAHTAGATSGNLVFATSNAASSSTARMTITSTGLVGINTQTIGSQLQVNGNAAIGYSASTAAPTNGLMVAGNVGVNVTPSAWASGFRAIQIGARTSFYNSDINFTGISNNSFYDGTFWRYLTTAATSSIELGVGVITFGNAPSGTAGATVSGTERARIHTDGIFYIGNGDAVGTPNTGIVSATGGTGSNVAGAEFRIRGGASTGSGAGGVISFYQSRAGTSGTTVNAAAEVARIQSVGISTDVTIFSPAGGYPRLITQVGAKYWEVGYRSGTTNFEIREDGTERFVIANGGNIGINTSTPGSRLQVNGNAAIGYSASTAAPTNGLSISGNTTIGTTTAAGKFTIDPDDNQIGLAITGTSLTGSNAQSLIDLAGTWNTTGNPTAIKLDITNTASGANSLLMDLQVGGTPEFRVTRTGNVVVNGSTSTYQMHVVGTGSLLALGEESFTTGRQMLFGIDGSGNGEIQSVHQGTSYRNLSINPLGGNVGIATSSPTSTLHANGSVAKAITTKTATYTLTSSDHTVIFNLNGNATANLPDATTCTGRIYMIKINRTNTTDTLTIDPNGTQTIDGFTTYALQCQYAVIIQSDGSNWQILGDFANGTNCL